MIFIFDVDGTLTPSRSKIEEHFEKWFNYWVDYQQSQGNQVWLISGSDLPKTIEQMGTELVNKMDNCFNCMGNTLYSKGDMLYENKFELSYELRNYLEQAVAQSEYPGAYPPHIESRPGMINFSVVGRGAVGDQRTEYYKWDLVHNQRAQLAQQINTRFAADNIVAHVGGETGLDIALKGYDKSQIIKYITEPAVFIGDKMTPGGNDYPLRAALERVKQFSHRSHNVHGYMDTMRILQSDYM